MIQFNKYFSDGLKPPTSNSPKVSGTKNEGTVPYKTVLGFPIHKP